MDVNEEYLKIFGRKSYPSLFSPDDEEYKALRQEIIAAPAEYYDKESLPFEDIKLMPYEKYINAEAIRIAEKFGHHIFYIRKREKGVLTCFAMGYYLTKINKFVVLKGSYFKDSDYSMSLSKRVKVLSKRIKPIKLFKADNGVIRQLSNVFCDSASIAASYILGKKSDYRQWLDEKGFGLDVFHSYFKASDIMERENQTFPAEVSPNINNRISSVVPPLADNQNVVAAKPEAKIVEAEKPKKPNNHVFFIRVQGQCNAMGYLDKASEMFIIIGGSSFKDISSNVFKETPLGISRQKFIKESCSSDGSDYVVTEDTACKSANEAASFILGKIATYASWTDNRGKTLKDIFPKFFTSNTSAKKKKDDKAKPLATQPVVNIVESARDKNMHLFYIKKNNEENRACDAAGYFSPVLQNFVVISGSRFALEVVPSLKNTRIHTERQMFLNKMCKKTADGYILKSDFVFNSPSAAATYVLGRTANGWIEWKDTDNRTLTDNYK